MTCVKLVEETGDVNVNEMALRWKRRWRWGRGVEMGERRGQLLAREDGGYI